MKFLCFLLLISFSLFSQTVEVRPSLDTWVSSIFQNIPKGDDHYLNLGTYFNANRVLVKFDKDELKEIIGDKDILEARFELSIYNHYINKSGSISLHKMNREWDANATWNCPSDTNPQNWSKECSEEWLMHSHNPNVDTEYPFNDIPFATDSIEKNQEIPLSYDVIEYVREVVESSENFGFLVKKDSSAINAPVKLFSSESEFSPKLILKLKEKVPSSKVNAVLNVNKFEGLIPFKVDFDASKSNAQSKITSIKLDFGNGSSQELDIQNPFASFEYTQEGVYPAVLTVSSENGETHTSAISISAFASEGNSVDRNYGYIISPDYAQLKYNSGDTAIIFGDICKVWKSDASKEDPRCHWVDKRNFHVQAFFPDMTTDVTSKLQLVTKNNKRSFEFAADDLKADEMNTLTVLVGEIDSKSLRLEQIKAKIAKRVQIVDRQIAELNELGSDQKMLEILQKVSASLKSVSRKIEGRNSRQPSILAQYNYPLQVDNVVSSPRYYSTLISGIRIEFSSDIGNIFEGEKVSILNRITNINYKKQAWHKVEGYNFNYEYMGEKVESRLINDFSEGNLFSYEFRDVDPSVFGDLSKLRVEVSEKYKWWSRSIAASESFQAIVEDNSAPVISGAPVNVEYVSSLPKLTMNIADQNGRIDVSSLHIKLGDEDISNLATLNTSNRGAEYDLVLDLSVMPLSEGEHSFEIGIADFKGQESNIVEFGYVLDRTAPQIIVEKSFESLTNNPSFEIPISVIDNSPVEVNIVHNGEVVYTSAEYDSIFATELTEGVNEFEIHVKDQSGNVAELLKLNPIVLDTIGPMFSTLSPSDGSKIYEQQFNIIGSSNESLSKIVINDVESDLAGATNFSKSYTQNIEGEFDLSISIFDIAGNETTYAANYELILKVINFDLVSIVPATYAPSKLIIRGAKEASRPGVTIEASTSFFTNETVSANEDGSFNIEMDFFESVTLSATDDSINKTETKTLNYNVDTTLAGVVKSTDDQPLPGVVLRLSSSGQSTVTDASGAFRIPNPITGDQDLIVDATELSADVVGENKKYPKITYSVSIGTYQSNVLGHPIFLAPLLTDGSETPVAEDTATTVTSIHAEGVVLEIPAGSAIFPDGTKDGVINMMEISSDKTTVPVPQFAVPDTVYALEPSGTVFSEPVELTLPNVNEFPDGMDVVILSKNSSTGEWEADGVATVDGSEITTKDGQGITHFSEVYAAPVGPEVTEILGHEKPGVDVFNGAVSTSISLPSYKVMGRDISAGLTYNSFWANPNVVVTNLFNIPRNYKLEKVDKKINRVHFDLVSDDGQVESWIEPEHITSQFFSNGVTSKVMKFEGVPYDAVVSYAMDMSHLNSGTYPYIAKYGIKLKHMYIQTATYTIQNKSGGKIEGYENWTYNFEKKGEIDLDEIFPEDLSGIVNLKNEKNSAYGRGWSNNAVSKILNPESSRLTIESNGNFKRYTLKDSISTDYIANQDVVSFDLHDYPSINYATTAKQIYQNGSYLKTAPAIVGSGRIRYVGFNQWGTTKSTCSYVTQVHKQYSDINSLYIHNSNALHSMSKGYMFLGGASYGVKENINMSGWSHPRYTQMSVLCDERDLLCDSAGKTSTATSGSFCNDQNYNLNYPVSGHYFVPGFLDGNLSSAGFNNPMGLDAKNDNEVVIADFGNNRVRLINLSSNTIRTIAGNGQTYDNGDNGQATSASLYHPRAVKYDSFGNLYIATDRGYIRKVDTNGYITTVAGYPCAYAGSVFANTAPADKVCLRSPSSIEIDEDNNFIYVADTGNKRVVRIDVDNNLAQNIAGNGTCLTSGNLGDGGTALNASLCEPSELHLTQDGNLLIGDKKQNRVRKLIFEYSDNANLAYASEQKDGSSLSKSRDGTFTLIHRNGTKVFFDSFGRQVASEDLIGNLVSYEYDADGNLTRQIDPRGGEIVYTYSDGLLESISDPIGRITQLEYDEGHLARVVYPDNSSEEFIYDADGKLTSEINQRGFETSYLYNKWGRLVEVVKSDDSSVGISDSTSQTIGNENIDGASGVLKSYGANDGALIDSVIDSNGNDTKFIKANSGHVSAIVDSQDRVTEIERDDNGLPIKIIKDDGSYTEFDYDPVTLDLLAMYDSSTDNTITYKYTIYGDILEVNDPRVGKSENIYNEFNQLVKKIDYLGRSTEYTYNAFGLVESVQNDLGEVTTTQYDENGNTISKILSNGETIIYARDDVGSISKVTYPSAKAIEYAFDVMNRLVGVKSAADEVTAYEYLATGELSKITDPQENVTTFEYDSLGQLALKTTPSGQVYGMSYDPNGNLESLTDPNGHVSSFEYDSLNQMVKKSLADNVYNFAYTDKGSLKTVQNNTTQLDYEYAIFEGKEIVISETLSGVGALSDYPTSTISYGYDELARKVSMTSMVGQTSYEHDSANRLSKITNPHTKSFDFSYDSINRMTEITAPFGKTVYTYADLYLAKISHQDSSSDVINEFSYGYDLSGNIVSKNSSKGISTFEYDDNNQLTKLVDGEVAKLESFQYDALGNRVTDSNGSFVYDAKKQLLESDYKFTYAYDLNGNLTTKVAKDRSTTENYIYDSENRLIKYLSYSDSNLMNEAEYFYDVSGRRVEKRVLDHENSKSSTRKFVYDGQNLIAKLDSSNDILASYTYSGLRLDDVLSVNFSDKGVTEKLSKSAGDFYYLKDHLGTVTDIVNESAEVVQHYAYSAYGEILRIHDGSANDIKADPQIAPYFTYTAREFDSESGLYYYRARMYDASVGRFLQVDPVSGILQEPLSVINKYVYAVNNPLKIVDPDGKFGFLAAVFVGAVIGAVVKSVVEGPSLKAILEGALVGAIGTMAGIGVLALAGPGVMGYALAGAASGFASSSSSIVLEGESLRSKKSISKILMSTAIGGATGAAVGVFVSRVNSALPSYEGNTVNAFGETSINTTGSISTETSNSVINHTFNSMKYIECAPLRSISEASFQACMQI